MSISSYKESSNGSNTPREHYPGILLSDSTTETTPSRKSGKFRMSVLDSRAGSGFLQGRPQRGHEQPDPETEADKPGQRFGDWQRGTDLRASTGLR